jgi:hypothetical protein
VKNNAKIAAAAFIALIVVGFEIPRLTNHQSQGRSPASSGGGCKPFISKTLPIPATAISGSETMAAESEALGPQSISLDFSGSLSLFPGNTVLQRMQLRTLINDTSDATTEALTDGNYFVGCRSGQPDISFIQSLVIDIKKKSDPDSAYVNLASGNYESSQPCSIYLDVNSNLDLNNYAGGYAIRVTPTGSYPSTTVYLGGSLTGGYSF